MVESKGPASPKEKALLALVLLAMPALIFFEWHSWHPGWARVDEATVFLWTSRWLNGIEADIRAGGGSLQHFILVCSSRLFGASLASLHLPQVFFILAESLLFFSLLRRRFGEREAVWALLCSLLCSFSLLRGRSLLSYSLLPLELLLLAELYERLPSAWGRALWGFCLGLVTLDYELWLYGAALAAAFAAFAPGPKGPKLAAGLGLALGLTWVAWISRDSLPSYAAVRLAKSSPQNLAGALGTLASHLKGFWLGGPAFPYIATPAHPVFPAWAWPGLALGAIEAMRRRRWLLLWALAGLLPLLFRSPGLEAQRTLLAWPALCALAGSGLALIAQKMGKRSALLLLLPIAGFAFELRAHARSMRESGPEIYGQAAAQLQAIDALRGLDGPLLLHFDFHSSSPARYLLAGRHRQSGQMAALIPYYDVAALKSENGRLQEFKDASGTRQAWLFFPQGASVSRLEEHDRKLASLWDTLSTRDRFARARQLEALLAGSDWRDPWLRGVLWSEYLEALHYLGGLEDRHLEALLSEKLPTAEPYRETALREGRRRPAFGIRLMERAAAIDPRLPFTPELRAPLEYFLALEQKAKAR